MPLPVGLERPEPVELLEAKRLEKADGRPPIALYGIVVVYEDGYRARPTQGKEAHRLSEQRPTDAPTAVCRFDVDPPDGAASLPAEGDLADSGGLVR